MPKLRGILDKSFNGYLTFRGFAKLKDIENLSEPDKAYQRDLIETHKDEIKDFLSSGHNLFFPEVILGCQFANEDEVSKVDPLYSFFNTQKGSMEFDFKKFKIKMQSRTEFQSGEDIRSIGYFRPVILDFLKKHQQEAQIQKPFKRIDGNHRISACSYIEEHHKDLNIPFCIVFFRDKDEEEKYSRILFHNINYKSIPLSMEESLKLILDDERIFPDEELKTSSSFGWEYYFAKQIKKEELNSYFHNLHNLFNDTFLTTFLKLFKLLITKDVIQQDDNEISKVRSALTEINTNIYCNAQLKNSSNSAVFIAFVFYQLKTPELISFLKSWVLKNEIFNIAELEPESIINIMSNIANHKVKKIFVAMPYYSHDRVTEYNRLFKEALKDVEESINLPFSLELIPIMRYRGESGRIDQRLLNDIRGCDIFIADLTGKNENVLYETAFAEGVGIPSLLIKKDDDVDESGNEITLPFDMDKRQYVPFQESSYYSSIKSIVKINFPKILEKGTWYE